MSHLQQNGRHNCHAVILAPCHVCDELVKLHGLEFHGRKIIIEEAKTPPGTVVNELSTSAVANDQQSMQKMSPAINDVRSRLPTAPTEEQRPIQNINSPIYNAVIPKKKNIPLFSDGMPRGMEMKHLNSQVKEGRLHLKAFPGAKANQLNHYVIPTLEEFDYHCAIIHIGINNILRSKDMSELKDLLRKIMQIGTTCQRYNIGKVYVSSILPLTKTSSIGQINKIIKELCHKNNSVFIDHQNLTSNDLWVDGIHLTNSGKAILARGFAENVNEFLCQNSNFQRSFIR